MILSCILSRSAKLKIVCIRLFKNNCADHVQCSSCLMCIPSEYKEWLCLISLGRTHELCLCRDISQVQKDE